MPGHTVTTPLVVVDQEMERPVDGDPQRDASGHHHADVDIPARPAQDSEDQQDRRQVGNHRYQPGRPGPQRNDHHNGDDDERRQETFPEPGEDLCLGVIQQRADTGPFNRHAGGGHDQFVKDPAASVGRSVVQPHADPPQPLTIGDVVSTTAMAPGTFQQGQRFKRVLGHLNREQLRQRHRVPHTVVFADLFLDVADLVELRHERQALVPEVDHRLESRRTRQTLFDPLCVLTDSSLGRKEIHRIDPRLQPGHSETRRDDQQQRQRGDQPTATDDPGGQRFTARGFQQADLRSHGFRGKQRQQCRHHGQPGDQRHDGTQGPGQAELSNRADVTDDQRSETDRGGQSGQAAGLPGQLQRRRQRIGTVHGMAVVVDQVNRDSQGKDHHHDRQRAQDEVHLLAGPEQRRQRQIDRPDGHPENAKRQLPVPQGPVQQHQADGQGDQEELLVVFSAAESVEFRDNHRSTGQLRVLELAVAELLADCLDRGGAVGEAFGREQRRDADQSVRTTCRRESLEPLAGLLPLDPQVVHDRHQPVGAPADPDLRKALDSLADRLDQFLVNHLLGVFPGQPHQHQFLGSEPILESVVDLANRRFLGQPGFDVVVRRQRLGRHQQDGKCQNQKAQHQSAVLTKERWQHGKRPGMRSMRSIFEALAAGVNRESRTQECAEIAPRGLCLLSSQRRNPRDSNSASRDSYRQSRAAGRNDPYQCHHRKRVVQRGGPVIRRAGCRSSRNDDSTRSTLPSRPTPPR